MDIETKSKQLPYLFVNRQYFQFNCDVGYLRNDGLGGWAAIRMHAYVYMWSHVSERVVKT